MKNSLPPLPNQLAVKSKYSGLVPKRRKKDYSSICWNEYFEQQIYVSVQDNRFRLLLHGSSGPILLLLHGAGLSALSWAVFTKAIHLLCDCQVVAMDFRGHGESMTDDDLNLDAAVLASDVSDVLVQYFTDLPPVVILGHSMGGAIAVHIAVQKLIPTLRGIAVIDVVEGSALDALPVMQSFLRGRPRHFNTLDTAIEWSIRSGQLRNLESAKISMPGQLKRMLKRDFSLDGVKETIGVSDSLKECDEDIEESNSEGKSSSGETSSDYFYTWRVDLAKTEPHWKGWFKDMSSLFLSCEVPKLLLLAGVDRLDKELTIGQMQGKFQMQILRNCGHMVHEDVPDQVAEIVTGFLIRQQLVQPKEKFPRQRPSC